MYKLLKVNKVVRGLVLPKQIFNQGFVLVTRELVRMSDTSLLHISNSLIFYVSIYFLSTPSCKHI